MSSVEINFDGLVGPTHFYGGLARGNMASVSHGGMISNPREAALQGLAKMKCLADLGIPQAVIPPQERPSIDALRRLGFEGNEKAILSRCARQAPELLCAVSSASSMWTANAATVTPSQDTQDGKVHFTPANLTAKFHRALEAQETGTLLKAIFRDEQYFTHHPPLPAGALGDEGAANHIRLAAKHGSRGLHLFVYGRSVFRKELRGPRKFTARQALEASQAVARSHRIPESRILFIQQNPDAIDAGVFHNDVISVGNESCLFYYDKAFVKTREVWKNLNEKFKEIAKGELTGVKVSSRRLSFRDAVRSYLFNSQLLTLPNGGMLLLAPEECRKNRRVANILEEIIASPENPIVQVEYLDLRQSMLNGGGPACLRLRVVLNEKERRALSERVFITHRTYTTLENWIRKHYRENLSLHDLRDPRLPEEIRAALDELTTILSLGTIYPFQQT